VSGFKICRGSVEDAVGSRWSPNKNTVPAKNRLTATARACKLAQVLKGVGCGSFSFSSGSSCNMVKEGIWWLGLVEVLDHWSFLVVWGIWNACALLAVWDTNNRIATHATAQACRWMHFIFDQNMCNSQVASAGSTIKVDLFCSCKTRSCIF
jgi:hypothetical protein